MGNIFDHRSAYFVGIGDTDIKPNLTTAPPHPSCQGTGPAPRSLRVAKSVALGAHKPDAQVPPSRQEHRRTHSGSPRSFPGWRPTVDPIGWGHPQTVWRPLRAVQLIRLRTTFCGSSQPTVDSARNFRAASMCPRDAFSTNPHLTFDYRWVVRQSVWPVGNRRETATWADVNAVSTQHHSRGSRRASPYSHRTRRSSTSSQSTATTSTTSWTRST